MAKRIRLSVYLQSFFVLCLFIFFVVSPVKAGFINLIENIVFNTVNEERTSRGLKALSIAPRLTQMARQHSKEMAEMNYFSHTSPVSVYKSMTDRANKAGVKNWRSLGENIASLSGYYSDQTVAEKVMNMWMNSEGHRKNILSGTFTHIGIGGYEKNGEYFLHRILLLIGHHLPPLDPQCLNTAMPKYIMSAQIPIQIPYQLWLVILIGMGLMTL